MDYMQLGHPSGPWYCLPCLQNTPELSARSSSTALWVAEVAGRGWDGQNPQGGSWGAVVHVVLK